MEITSNKSKIWKLTGVVLLGLLASCVATHDKHEADSQPVTIAAPDWYDQQSTADPNHLVGYGSGPNRDAADQQALADIGRQRESWVQSEIDSRVERKRAGNTDRYLRQRIQIQSQQHIRDARRVHAASQGGRYFVEWQVDLRPPWQILAERVLAQWRQQDQRQPGDIQWQAPKALAQARFAERLRARLTDASQASRQRIPLYLDRRDESWSVQLLGASQTIDNLFGVLDFSVYATPNLELAVNDAAGQALGQRLTAGQRFYFRLINDSTYPHCALFNVYPDGRVSLLWPPFNLANRQRIIPNPLANNDSFEAATLADGQVALDTYLAVCTAKLDGLTQFRMLRADAGFVQGQAAYRAHRLVEWLDTMDHKAVAAIEVESVPHGDK